MQDRSDATRPSRLSSGRRMRLSAALVVLSIAAVACSDDDATNLNPTRDTTKDDSVQSTTTVDPLAAGLNGLVDGQPDSACDYVNLAMTRAAEESALAAGGDELSRTDALATLSEIPGDMTGDAADKAAAWAEQMRAFLQDPVASRSEMISASWIQQSAQVETAVAAACQ